MSQTSPIETSTGSGSRTSTEGWRSPMPAVPFLTVREAAELLRVSPTRVRHLIYFGQLKAEKVGPRWLLPKDEMRRYQGQRRQRHVES